MPLDTGIAGAIADSSDKDTFQFKTPPKYRDWIEITLENRSTTLVPRIELYNADKSDMGGTAASTAGANVKHTFVALPDTVYYVQVAPVCCGGSSGAYSLSVKPLKAYDAYEPNDDIRHAAAIGLGKTVDANIMDAGDTDFYQFKTSKGGNVLVSVTNRSTTLVPDIAVFDADKSRVGGTPASTPGADHRYSFPSQPNAMYYVQISPVCCGGSSGAYSLAVTEQ